MRGNPPNTFIHPSHMWSDSSLPNNQLYVTKIVPEKFYETFLENVVPLGSWFHEQKLLLKHDHHATIECHT